MTELADDLTLLAIATSGVRDLYMGYSAAEVVARAGGKGIDDLLVDLVSDLRGRGYDDEGLWNCQITDGIVVSHAATPLDPHGVIEDIAFATTALRDLREGGSHSDLRAPKGERGIAPLIRHLVGTLRRAGVDDEGHLDCNVTWDIRVSDPVVVGWTR